MSEDHFESKSPVSVKPSDDGSPGQQVDCSIMREPEPESSNKSTLEFLTHRKCDTINIYYFKQLSAMVICFVAIDNQYTATLKDAHRKMSPKSSASF